MSTTDAHRDCSCCENQQALRTELVEQKKLAGSYKNLHAKAKSREEKAKSQLHEFRRENKDKAALLGKIKELEGRLSALGIEGANPFRRTGEENKRLKKQVKELEVLVRGLQGRIESLKGEREKLKTQVARLSRSLYESGNESRRKRRGSSSKDKGSASGSSEEKKRRKEGNSRTKREGLEEVLENMEASAYCEECGEPFVSNGWEESSTTEVEVRPHKRIIRRQRVRGKCECSRGREVVAKAPARLFPHSEYGNSVWAFYLYQRFSQHQTLCGVARWFENVGARVPKGTLGSRDRAFLDMFGPMGEAIAEHLRGSDVIHGDETGWRLMKLGSQKGNTRAWLWLCASEDAVLVNIDKSRSAAAGLELFGGLRGPGAVQYLVCDRYCSYSAISKETGLTLVFCWAHVRRDFIDVGRGDKEFSVWCARWLKRIGNLYGINRKRVDCFDRGSAKGFKRYQRRLEEEVEKFFDMAEKELKGTVRSSAKSKPLSSLISHREGLSVFVGAPAVPMDNNLAEREIRPAVIARKLSYGSQSECGAKLMSCLYSVAETLRVNGINAYRWFLDYLDACAHNGGRAPEDLSRFLPWTMDEQSPGSMSVVPRGMSP